MTVRGYAPEPRAWEPILVLAPTEPCSVTGCALPLADCPDVPRMLTHRPADLPPDARIVLVDGCIVAAAWTTPEGIAVETAPAYRRRGHARAAASALIADLDRAGREVRWRVRASNAASCALAASLGLRETAREYRPTFRRMN